MNQSHHQSLFNRHVPIVTLQLLADVLTNEERRDSCLIQFLFVAVTDSFSKVPSSNRVTGNF